MILGALAVAVGLTAIGTVTRAQEEITVEIVSVDAAGTAPVSAANSAPAMSDDAGILAFDTVDGAGETVQQVWIRNRSARTSRPVAEQQSRAPGISGDGCVVAYSVVGADSTTLTVADLCATAADSPIPLGAIVESIPNVTPEGAIAPVVAAPALSSDGTVLVWSTGDEIRRYAKSSVSAAYERTDAFDSALDATPDAVTGGDVDISADGATVAFVAGPGAAPYGPQPANVLMWSHRNAAVEPTIEVVSATTGGTPGASDSGSPTVSSDGSLIVFDSVSTDLAAVGAGVASTPFVVAVDVDGRTTGLLVADAADPSLSGDAKHVVYTRGDAIRVLSVSETGEFDTDRSLAELSGVAPTSRASISRSGRWLAFDATHLPGGGDPAFASGTQVWVADVSPTDPTTATTTTPPTGPTTNPATSIPTGTSVPVTTVGPVTSFPPPTTAPRPRPRFSSRIPRSRNTTRFSTSDLAGSEVSAMSITFAPTVVDAGRRSDSVVLSNLSARSVVVDGSMITPPGPFSIVDDGCTGSLSVGSTCVVQVDFAPTSVGPLTASLVFQLAGQPAVVATLEGTGSPEPTLDVVPAVAGAGQTVTVFGAGFPAGSSVSFERQELPGSEPVIVDADGTFAHVVVVVPNTPSGPTTWAVQAQPDEFERTTAELLVSTRGAASGGPALRGSLIGRG